MYPNVEECCSRRGAQAWNEALRDTVVARSREGPGPHRCRYATTAHILVSAIVRLAAAARVSPACVVWRGLGDQGGRVLLSSEAVAGTGGGLVTGFFAASDKEATAFALAMGGGKGGQGAVLEVDVGHDGIVGAQMDFLSQYPGEVLR